MFRVRLAAVIAVSFCFVLVLGGMLYWGAGQVDLNVQRSQAAYEAFDRYERLSHEAFRHFKQRMDRLATEHPAADAGVKDSKHRLYQAMESLRKTAIQANSDGDPSEEIRSAPGELERVARFTAFLEASDYRFAEVERLRQQGKSGPALQILAKYSEEEIDGKFQPLNQMAGELEFQQQKLREGNAVLEKRVAERTFELHQLNHELRRMDTERRVFLADISHELRTPITIIRGEAEVTLRGNEREAEEYKDALERIAELSEQLGKYVNDLLFLARAETANLHFEWDRLDLSELLADAALDFQVMAQENSLSVDWDRPATPVWIRGDKQRLRQVLFILGDNACRYSNPGGHIAAVLRIDGEQAVFTLSDQGIGIPTQDLERIFDRHFRSSNARQSREEGSGLGLPMAKAILKAHGGQITVASAENAGATFTITLPLFSHEEAAHERATP